MVRKVFEPVAEAFRFLLRIQSQQRLLRQCPPASLVLRDVPAPAANHAGVAPGWSSIGSATSPVRMERAALTNSDNRPPFPRRPTADRAQKTRCRHSRVPVYRRLQIEMRYAFRRRPLNQPSRKTWMIGIRSSAVNRKSALLIEYDSPLTPAETKNRPPTLC